MSMSQAADPTNKRLMSGGISPSRRLQNRSLPTVNGAESVGEGKHTRFRRRLPRLSVDKSIPFEGGRAAGGIRGHRSSRAARPHAIYAIGVAQGRTRLYS